MSAQMVSTRLTREYLERWMKKHHPYHQVQTAWDDFSRSTEFLDSFRLIPDDIIQTVYLELHGGMSVHTIGSYFNLALKAQQMFPNDFTWEMTRHFDAWNVHNDFPDERSLEFDTLLEEFDLFCEADAPGHQWGVYYYCFTVMLLRAIHGEEVVMQLLKKWMDSGIIPELGEIIAIADNWDNLCEYPFEWTLSLVSASTPGKMRIRSKNLK